MERSGHGLHQGEASARLRKTPDLPTEPEEVSRAGHAHHEVTAAPHEAEIRGPSHHELMVREYRRRFWASLTLTVPILLLSPLIRDALHLEVLAFPGDRYVLLALSAFVYGWGGLPFLRGAARELSRLRPAMMSLIAIAISAAFLYSAAVVLGLKGDLFFW